MKLKLLLVFVITDVIIMYHGISWAALIDNSDGTITDTKTGLMWTQDDSHVMLGKCLSWYQSKRYVDNLETGGFTDWRMPTIAELETIYIEEGSVIAYDNDSAFPLHLDPVFSPYGAYWYWSSDDAGSCCKRYMYFSNGSISGYVKTNCTAGGVRAVREAIEKAARVMF